jgi:hypothetical protein
MEPLLDLRDRFGILIVEDAAEALGARIGESEVGTIGDIGCVSFNGNKVITAGGGGMIVTDNADLASKCRHLTTQAKLAGRACHAKASKGLIAELHDAGYVELRPGRFWLIPSPALLDHALCLREAGIDIEVSALIRDLLRRRHRTRRTATHRPRSVRRDPGSRS